MTVSLVGAGPGARDLLTLRAHERIVNAEAVVYDRLVSPEVLELIAPSAERYNVGKSRGDSGVQGSINDLLVDLAARHERVVRLKGGDPFVFGRGAEEVAALTRCGVEVEVVPGLSSLLAAPALAGIALTTRGLSRRVVLTSAVGEGGEPAPLGDLVGHVDTFVVVMGSARRGEIASELLDAGLAPVTPVASVEWASWPEQRVRAGLLGELDRWEGVAPSVLVVGEVARGVEGLS